jgi:SPOR domain
VSEELEMPSAATYRVPRRRGMDAGTKRLAVIACGLGAALLAVVGIWSVGERQGGRLPVVEADSRPLRVKPDNPGGLQLAGTNDEILSGESGPQNGKLAPPPESPAPQALRTPPQAARSPESGGAVGSVDSVAPPSPARATPAAPVQAVHASTVQTPAQPAETQRAETPRAETPRKDAVSRAATSSASPGSHAAEVQLAALGSEEAAKAEWDRLAKRMPDLLNGRRPAVSKTEREGRTYWRLRTGGFSDIAQATSFCERVRAKGAGCSLASF